MGTTWKVEGMKSLSLPMRVIFFFLFLFVLFKTVLQGAEEFEKIVSEYMKSVLKGQSVPLVIFML